MTKLKLKIDPRRLTVLRIAADRLQQTAEEAADLVGDHFEALQKSRENLTAAEANLSEAVREGDQRGVGHYRAVVEAAKLKVQEADQSYDKAAESAERARDELHSAWARLAAATKFAERAAARGEIKLPPNVEKQSSRTLKARAVR